MKITYIGDCPGADDDAIDERLSPHELLSSLAKRGILPATQRPDLGTHAAHDRRRFYSIPGGVPSPQWLGAQWPKRTLVDVHAGDALAGLANQTLSRGNTLIDFAPHLGCACAGAVGGVDAQDARKAVVALEPPRAQSEIVNADVRVEVSLAPAGERPHAEVSWNDFLAALPAALAMHPEGPTAPVSMTTRTAPRRVMQKKAALPRAYMATRRGARRERTPMIRTGTTQPLAHVQRAQEAAAAASASPIPARGDAELSRRDEITATRPNAWVARRASHEGMTGPRVAAPRSGLATADRWLLSGLMLTSSILVAVLTSALTVRGMSRGAMPTLAARAETVYTVAAVAAVAAPVHRDSASVARESRASDSILVASNRAADSASRHEEDGGTVAPAPSSAPRLSPMPSQRADVPKRAVPVPRRSIAVAEHARPRVITHNPVLATQSAAPVTTTLPSPPTSSPSQLSASAPPQTPVGASFASSSPVAVSAQPSPNTTTSQPTSAPMTSTAPAAGAVAAAAPANNNAQFLEELRAIHAEIDARKKHMDSLTKSLDSLKRVTRPE
jgi:hypothetical protein